MAMWAQMIEKLCEMQDEILHNKTVETLLNVSV